MIEREVCCNISSLYHDANAAAEDEDFLVLYEDMLTVGQEYELSYYVTTDMPGTAAGFSLVHEDWPDINSSNSGIAAMNDATLQNGGWQKLSYTFTAKTQWIAIRFCKKQGFSFIALTDHQIYNFQNFAPETGVLVIPGMEYGNDLVKGNGFRRFHTVCIGPSKEDGNGFEQDQKFD